MQFKFLEKWLELDTKTGQFIEYAKIKPIGNGGDERIIRLTVDSGVPFNSLANGWHEYTGE